MSWIYFSLKHIFKERKLHRFVISVTTDLSRNTLALAAVNFGVRVLLKTLCLDLETSVLWHLSHFARFSQSASFKI